MPDLRPYYSAQHVLRSAIQDAYKTTANELAIGPITSPILASLDGDVVTAETYMWESYAGRSAQVPSPDRTTGPYNRRVLPQHSVLPAGYSASPVGYSTSPATSSVSLTGYGQRMTMDVGVSYALLDPPTSTTPFLPPLHTARPLCLLALGGSASYARCETDLTEDSTTDGGGVRGVSELTMLKHLMQRVSKLCGVERTIQPREVFDMIAGTSTGG